MRKGIIAIAIAVVLSAGSAQAVSPQWLEEVADAVIEFGRDVGVPVARHAVIEYLKQKWFGKPVPPTDQAQRIKELTRRMSENQLFPQQHYMSDAERQDLLRRLGIAPTH